MQAKQRAVQIDKMSTLSKQRDLTCLDVGGRLQARNRPTLLLPRAHSIDPQQFKTLPPSIF